MLPFPCPPPFQTILYIKANMVSVCPSVCGDKNKMRSWNEQGPQNLWGPEPRWPESSIKDLNRDSQYPVQTSKRTWKEVPKKKTRRWGPETRSSKRKLVVRSWNEDALRLAVLGFGHIEEELTAKHRSGSVLGGVFESLKNHRFRSFKYFRP
jgi:hypothetical protein